MAIDRVADSRTFDLLTSRMGELQVQLRILRDRIATGRKILVPDDDPLGAAQVVRSNTALAAIDQYSENAKFGFDVMTVLHGQLSAAKTLLGQSQAYAAQYASTTTAAQRAQGAEIIAGQIEELTTIGNTEFAGRRVFAGLALDAAAPFADPETPGYTPASAFTGSTADFSVKIGGTAGERVRVGSRGDQVLGPALQALSDLRTALLANDEAGIQTASDAIAAAFETVSAEHASIGARQAHLKTRLDQLPGLKSQEAAIRAGVLDADLITVISDLTEAQTALQALLTATSQIVQTNLSSLIRV